MQTSGVGIRNAWRGHGKVCPNCFGGQERANVLHLVDKYRSHCYNYIQTASPDRCTDSPPGRRVSRGRCKRSPGHPAASSEIRRAHRPTFGRRGLPEYTQHLSTVDYVVVSGKRSLFEAIIHLHEHFVHPAKAQNGYYVTPTDPRIARDEGGEYGRFPKAFPSEEGKSFWKTDAARPILEASRML